ncbi:MAG TPA: hypothetical protein VNJ03_11360 [Vicinamibacterales bacterium]|nr:hypothetical protein [Vicinamibacterales bacterium]
MALLGSVAAFHYWQLGLTLTHYDARAHLVVARRVLDSLTPGWQQIGAVWLPLPHILNMVPVQVDAWYRSGASGVVISIVAMAVAAGSLASLLIRITGSVTAAITGAALLMLNPNVLYLQSTPMTEPLLFGLSLLGIASTASWLDGFEAPMIDRPTSDGLVPPGLPWLAGTALAAASLTRYEAWAITGAVVALSCAVLLRRGTPFAATVRAALGLAALPVLAVVVFSMNSRWVVGAWFVTGGFFVPENVDALGHPLVAWQQIADGLRQLSGWGLVWGGYIGAALLVFEFARSRTRASVVLLLALAAAAALPMFAYLQGHPFRIRYDLPLVAAAAALCAGGINVLPKLARLPVALVALSVTIVQAGPFDREAPLIRESSREAAAMAGRRGVTAYLQQHHGGQTIMMSMGSLGHYMHDLSLAGFRIKDFLHEGNGEIWRFAMLRPSGHAGWLIIEESAEGGDALHHAAKRDQGWLQGFEKVAEGGGASLYRFKVPGSTF